MNAGDAEDGDDVPIVAMGFEQLHELYAIADYQDPPTPVDEEPVATAEEIEDDEPSTAQDRPTTATGPATGLTGSATLAGANSGLMGPPARLDSGRQQEFEDLSIAVPHTRLASPLSDMELATGLYCDIAGVPRSMWPALRALLELGTWNISDTRSLPNTMDTVRSHIRRSLPLLEMRMVSIPVNPDKLPSSGKGKIAEDFFYFELETLLQAYLSTASVQEKMHTGLGFFVDAPAELWEADCWHSSIRTSSGIFARYPDRRQQQQSTRQDSAAIAPSEFRGTAGGPIFPSDFVQFQCDTTNCSCQKDSSRWHNGRVLGVARDRRTHRLCELDSVVVKIQRTYSVPQLPTNIRRILQEQPGGIQAIELLIAEHDVVFVLPAKVRPPPFSTVMHYTYQSAHCPQLLPDGKPNTFIRRIWNNREGTIRPVWQAHPIRGELEIMHFGRQSLIDRFDRTDMDVLSMPFIMFIDGFGLYRNMYRSLMGFYLINGAFSYAERSRPTNLIPLTLGPHGSNMEQVAAALMPSLRKLDSGMELTVDGKEKFVCAFTLFFTGDMPQQQENSGMLKQNATYGCRFCYTPKGKLGDLTTDLVATGRYHHEVERLRAHLRSLPTKYQRKHFCDRIALGMNDQGSPLQSVSPALDVILTRPGDPAHSEFGGITKLLHNLLLDAVLTESAKREYNGILRKFRFPPDWQHLPSALHHLGSYTLSEHARWSIIGPIVLRTWLKDVHLKPQFVNAIPLAMHGILEEMRAQLGSAIPFSFVVITAFARVANSNRMLMSHPLSVQRHSEMLTALDLGRQTFQAMCEAASIASNRGSRPTSRAGTPASLGLTAAAGRLDLNDEADEVSKKTIRYRRDQERPNVHTGRHYPAIIQEYGLAANCNVLVGEQEHKVFKERIYKTNHNRPERDLLRHINMQMTARFLILGGFRSQDPALTAQVRRIKQACPGLLDRLLPPGDRNRAEALALGEEEDASEEPLPVRGFQVTDEPGHDAVKVRMMLSLTYVREQLGLPTRGENMTQKLRALVTAAFELDLDMPIVTAFQKVPIKWWKEISFNG